MRFSNILVVCCFSALLGILEAVPWSSHHEGMRHRFFSPDFFLSSLGINQALQPLRTFNGGGDAEAGVQGAYKKSGFEMPGLFGECFAGLEKILCAPFKCCCAQANCGTCLYGTKQYLRDHGCAMLISGSLLFIIGYGIAYAVHNEKDDEDTYHNATTLISTLMPHPQQQDPNH